MVKGLAVDEPSGTNCVLGVRSAANLTALQTITFDVPKLLAGVTPIWSGDERSYRVFCACHKDLVWAFLDVKE